MIIEIHLFTISKKKELWKIISRKKKSYEVGLAETASVKPVPIFSSEDGSSSVDFTKASSFSDILVITDRFINIMRVPT